MRSHDAPPQSFGCAEGCHRPPQHPASGAGRSVSACTFVHARSASAHGWPVTVEPTSLGWLVLRDDGMPRTPIRPDRAAADRQACRSLQDRHCRGELARTQLPSQAGDVLKGLQREASRNVQGRRYVSVPRCAYVPAVTTDKEPVPGNWWHNVVLLCHRSGCLHRAVVGDPPRNMAGTGTQADPKCVVCPTYRPASPMPEDACRAAPRPLSQPQGSRRLGLARPSRPGTAPWPDIPSGSARTW